MDLSNGRESLETLNISDSARPSKSSYRSGTIPGWESMALEVKILIVSRTQNTTTPMMKMPQHAYHTTAIREGGGQQREAVMRNAPFVLRVEGVLLTS